MNEADPIAREQGIAATGLFRSLFRLRGGGAPFSLCLIALTTFAAVFGPFITPHPYDRVFRDYVFTPPSLATHPDRSERDQAVADFASAMHVKVLATRESASGLALEIAADHPIDLRVLRYFERSDVFATAATLGSFDEGRRLRLAVPIKPLLFPFGTDANGRDLSSRLFIGLRVSLAVGLLASLVALVIGVVYGATAGYVGGIIDMVMMRVVEIIYALPFIFFVIVLVVVFGRHFALIFAAIGAVEWLDMARITRGQALSIKQQDYVLAAQALGASPMAILWRHVIANMAGPIIAFTTLLVPRVILAESFVSFLGLGVQEPLTSLGLLIADGARNIQSAPYLLIFPALWLAILLAALTRLGHVLTDRLAGRRP
ncbi:MAG: ABC transporter permease [Beijerinckiaceae bacterium]